MTAPISQPLLTVDIPSFSDSRGSLSVVEEGRDFSWHVADVRTTVLTSANQISTDGAPMLIVPLRGEITLQTDNSSDLVTLCTPTKGVLVAAGCKANILSTDAIVLIIEGQYETNKVSALPFPVRRVFYLHNLPPGSSRGAHAHRTHYQLIRAAAGKFSVTVDTGTHVSSHTVDSSSSLCVEPGVWNTLCDFTPDAICLVLASELYDESLYLRDYDDFLKFRGLSK